MAQKNENLNWNAPYAHASFSYDRRILECESLMQTHTIQNNPPVEKKTVEKGDTEKLFQNISSSSTNNNSNNAKVEKKTHTDTWARTHTQKHTHTHETQSARYGCFVCGLSSYPSIDVCVFTYLFGRTKAGNFDAT